MNYRATKDGAASRWRHRIRDFLLIPRDLVEKTPSDGLTGLSDEDKIGFSYDDLDTVIRGSFKGCPNHIRKNLCELPEETWEKIQDRLDAVRFKTKPNPIEVFRDIEFTES